MFRYFYLICIIANKNKYWTRKKIYLDNKLYTFEDQRYNIKQINKLINNLQDYQYNKINSSVLP